jgi:MFS family permease
MTGGDATETTMDGWRSLLRREWLPPLVVLAGGVLLHSMNVLLLATVLPTIVGELGGAALMHWPTTAFLASSIVAATCTGMLTGSLGARTTFCIGTFVFGLGSLVCALAPTMTWIIAGRFVAGFGGGLLGAVSYVVVGDAFPERTWSRVIALLSGMWSVSILVGPLAGGVFALWGAWRGVFVAVMALAALLALAAFRTLPNKKHGSGEDSRALPVGRVLLICLAIAGTSYAAITPALAGKAALIALAVAALAVMLAIDRMSGVPLLPRDAFSLHSETGVGLWLILLLAVSYSPLQIYIPIFLQRLHGFDPLTAGYAVAGASLGWTVAALATAGAQRDWPEVLILTGPVVMGIGLAAVACLTAVPPGYAVVPAVVLVGIGIGCCWAFVAQRTMSRARKGDETVAASSVATVQQMGFALGAALAGLAANASGFADGDMAPTFWVPMSFVAATVLSLLAALRLRALR